MNKKTNTSRSILTCLINSTLMVIGLLAGNVHADENEWPSENKYFVASYQPSIIPVPLNQIHEWTLFLKKANGSPVTDAVFQADGGMPAHNHGLPTSPEVAKGDIPGSYRIQGLRFHMMGYWEIRLDIEAGGIKDTVVIPLEL